MSKKASCQNCGYVWSTRKDNWVTPDCPHCGSTRTFYPQREVIYWGASEGQK